MADTGYSGWDGDFSHEADNADQVLSFDFISVLSEIYTEYICSYSLWICDGE